MTSVTLSSNCDTSKVGEAVILSCTVNDVGNDIVYGDLLLVADDLFHKVYLTGYPPITAVLPYSSQKVGLKEITAVFIAGLCTRARDCKSLALKQYFY